ncbi:tyrosine-type recombinase/integrase [Gordonia sp. NPDC003950]
MAGRPRLDVGTHGKISSKRGTPCTAWCRYRDLDGRTRVVTASGTSKADAERRLQRKLTHRVTPADETITADTRIRALADAWLADVERSDRATNTKKRYDEVVRTYVVPAMGELRVRECTTSRCNGHLQTVSEKIGAATAKVMRSVLSGMFQLAIDNGACDRNPLRDLRITAPKSKPKALSIEEVRDLRTRLRADPKAVRSDVPDVVDFLVATGVRIGEALAVRWSDLDLAPADDEAPTVRIHGTVIRIKGQGLVIQPHGKGKADDDVLVLALPSWVVPVLMERQLGSLPNAEDAVFASAVGTLRDPCNFRDSWRAARDRLGVEDWVKPHTMRKAVATAVATAKGAQAAADQLGHASDAVTRAHYIERVRRADHREVVDQFNPASVSADPAA